MRAPFVPTDPVKAKQIALHTEEVLKQVRACEHQKHLAQLHDGYMAYAASMGVAKPIVDHVISAFDDVNTLLKAREANARVVRDPTGERAA